MTKIPDNFIKMAKCRLCGKLTNDILINQRLKEIPDNQAYSQEPCNECKKRFKDHKFFIGECGHQGFIKTKALKIILTPASLKDLGKQPIFRTDKCPVCLGLFPKKCLTENTL